MKSSYTIQGIQPEVVVSDVLDYTETRFQLLYPCFRGRPIQWTRRRHRPTPELQDGSRQAGSSCISRSRLDRDAIPTGILMLPGSPDSVDSTRRHPTTSSDAGALRWQPKTRSSVARPLTMSDIVTLI
jgi:hypothetical protein